MQTKKTAVRNVLSAVFVLYCCSQMVLRAELWSVLLDGPSEIVPAFELVLIDAQLLVEHVVLFHLAFRNIRGVAFLS